MGTNKMKLRAGDRASRDEDIQCNRCGRRVHVSAGQKIPQCNCGSVDFREPEDGEEEEEEEES